MKFTPVGLEGAFLVELEPFEDDRGAFARTFCAREFREHGLMDTVVQCSLSRNLKRGTLRGMHFQNRPSCEVKLVRCTRGSLWDVIVDMRPDSPTYLQSYGAELSEANRRSLYIPEMFAHGFLTLEDETEAFYMMNEDYAPELSTGVRHDDPKLGIPWPGEVSQISEKDCRWDLLS